MEPRVDQNLRVEGQPNRRDAARTIGGTAISSAEEEQQAARVTGPSSSASSEGKAKQGGSL